MVISASIILSVFVFAILFYVLYPTKATLFEKFDVFFGSMFFLFLCTRIIGIIFHTKNENIGWSLSPLTGEGEDVFYFSSWPWIVLRVWDGYFDFSFVFLYGLVSIACVTYFLLKRNRDIMGIWDAFWLSFVVAFDIFLALQTFFGFGIVHRSELIQILGQNATSLLIYSILLIFVVAFRILNARQVPGFVFGFVYVGVVGLIFKLVSNSYIDHINGMDLYFLESGVLIVVALVYIFVEISRMYIRPSAVPNNLGASQNDGRLKNWRQNSSRMERVNWGQVSRNRFANPLGYVRNRISSIFGKSKY